MPNDKLKKSADFYSGFGAELKPIAHDTTFLENAPTNKRYPKEMHNPSDSSTFFHKRKQNNRCILTYNCFIPKHSSAPADGCDGLLL